MALFMIPEKWETLWDQWSLRVFVLVSLFIQIVLIFAAASRKRTGNRIIAGFIWSAYLFADWVATFAVGLISNRQGEKKCNLDDKSSGGHQAHQDLAAFWAPFLLLHLGGPDTITAFSLEDNELWLRHLLGLVLQFLAVAYVFSQSVPNEFWLPTLLLFAAGTIKYAERTRALYLACLGNFKSLMLQKPDAGPSYAQLMEDYSSKKDSNVPVEIKIETEHAKGSKGGSAGTTSTNSADQLPPTETLDDISVVRYGYSFFNKFKGLLVELMFSFHERTESRDFFFKRKPEDAFKVLEVELNFMYDVLYTKMGVVYRRIGYLFRLVSSVLIVVAFQQFAFRRKRNVHHFDTAVTYTLLAGAVGLDLVAIVKLIFSDWTLVSFPNSATTSTTASFLSSFPGIVLGIRRKLLLFDKIRWRWSNSVSQHSLIRYCLEERIQWLDRVTECFGSKELFDETRFKKTEDFKDNLKNLIFDELRYKAGLAEDSRSAREIYSARGSWVLQDFICDTSILSSVSEDVEYDESLLLWHVATELCYCTHKSQPEDDETKQSRESCKLLSEYMVYLLIMRPTMMSAVAGIGQIRFQDTCEEARKFFRRVLPGSKASKFAFWRKRLKRPVQSQQNGETRSAWEALLSVNTEVKPVEVKGDRSQSLLFDACILAKDLEKLEEKKRWKMMSKVWVELLCYAASHCRADAHAQQLSKGGELLTFVWLLMAHFGLGEQFRIEAGHARAKLIILKDEEEEEMGVN